jgi:hypothetical protein
MPGFNLVKVWRAASTIKGGYWIIDILGFVTSKPVGCVVLWVVAVDSVHHTIRYRHPAGPEGCLGYGEFEA